MIKAVIFDMDGVLIDSQPMHYEVDKRCLEEAGIRVSLEELQEGAGSKTKTRYAQWKEEYHLEQDVEQLVKRRREIEEEILEKTNLQPIDGIQELLEDLQKRGLEICVASSSPHKLIERILTALHIQDYFKFRLGSEDVKEGKPSPEIFLSAVKKLGLAKEECVVIEDSRNGVLAANAAGIKVIGYQNYHSGDYNLDTADLIIKDFYQLNGKVIQNLAQ